MRTFFGWMCALAWTSTPHAVAPQDAAPRLLVGVPIERLLSGPAPHRYTITLAPDEFVEVRVEQQGIDVGVSLFGPAGEPATPGVNLSRDIVGTERVYGLSDAGGDYVIEVRTANENAPKGSYAVEWRERRIADPEDRMRVEAQRGYADADAWRRDTTGESLRRAVPLYEKALELWRSAGDRWHEAQTLSALGLVWTRLADYRKALECDRQALTIRQALGERRLEAISLNNIGSSYLYMGDFAAALEYYQLGLPIRRETGDRNGEAFSLSNIGIAYQSMGQAERALEFYPGAVDIWRAIGNKSGEALGLHNWGSALAILGDPQMALEYFGLALALRRGENDRAGEAQTLSQIGNQYLALGNDQAALEIQLQALPLRQRAGDRRGEGYTLGNLANSYTGLGEPRLALDHAERALVIFRAIGDRDGESAAISVAARAHYLLGDFARALSLYTQAVELYRANGNRRGEAEVSLMQTDALRGLGRHDEALQQLTAAAAVFAALRIPTAEAVTAVRLARLDRDAGRLEAARDRLKPALEAIESLRSSLTIPELRASYLSSQQNAFGLYVDVLMALHRQQPSGGYAALALQANERTRARRLIETLAAAGADVGAGVDAGIREQERAAQRRVNLAAARVSRVFAGTHSEADGRGAEAALATALTELQQAQVRVSVSEPQYAALTQVRPLDVPAIQQRMLDADTVLLEYALGPERSYVWAVSRDRLEARELPPSAEIEAAARRAYAALTDSHRIGRRADLRDALATLSRMIVQPIAREIAGKRLLIVADGALQFIPFGVLPDPLAGTASLASTPPLIAAHEIIAAPSASVIDSLRHARPPGAIAPDRVLAVLADPVLHPSDPRVAASGRALPMVAAPTEPTRPSDLQRSAGDVGVSAFSRLQFTRAEAQAVTRLAGSRATLAALDFDASRVTATAPELARYGIVHFATHAFADSEHPELSGIVLSLVTPSGAPQDGFLRLHDIYNLRLGADLVVLSACETALGKAVRGEGLVGLTRGFMYAGVPRVVASLWRVRDQGTAELITRFYRAMLRGGLTPAAALRHAQISMWKDPAWNAPFYWAGFTIQGDWQPARPQR